MKEAKYYKTLGENKVKCLLCPRECTIENGTYGACLTRKNVDGKLYSVVYGKISSMAIDPIEKKPLFHFWPGSPTFSISTVGCNLKCMHCQNWTISQVSPDHLTLRELDPESVVRYALRYKCNSISYTYNEPLIWFEFVLDTAKEAKKEGIMNILVTNGFINEDPLKELLPYIDAANVDLKSINDEFYRKICKADKAVEHVQRTIVMMKESKVHVEITNLIIPTENDKEDEIRKLSVWVLENVGETTPLHFTRFHPDYKLTFLPPTPIYTLERAREIAISEGLKYVYIGNVPGHSFENTYCPRCHSLLIGRYGFSIINWNLTEDNRCKNCGESIPIVGKRVESKWSFI